jgi:hypothetical protein
MENPIIKLIYKKENEKKQKTALQYCAATGPSTVGLRFRPTAR